jgi:hypothetical protein
MAQEAEAEVGEDHNLLMALIYGVLHETDITTGAAFAVRLAVCAQLAGGDQDLYSKYVKRAVVNESRLVEMFPEAEVKAIVRGYLRAIRRARARPELVTWLTTQFAEPQDEDAVKEFLVQAERELCRNFLGREA